MPHPIEFKHVWKRYRIGAGHDSLRDLIPQLAKRLVGGNGAAGNGHALNQGEFWALQDMTFHVKKGETLGIVGPNGAGKSTTLKLLSKIAKQTEGTISHRGRLAALIELGGGFHPDLSGEENIYLQGTMLGLRTKEIKRLFKSIVEFSELGEFLSTPVKRYSSGMTVRLGFAVAAHIHPDVLLIDEVLAVGDLSFQQKCFQRISELKQKGVTMIFISHNLDAVQRLCDRVLLLRKGQVLAEGAPGDMLRRYREEVLASTSGSQPGGGRNVSAKTHGFAVKSIRFCNADGVEVPTIELGQPLRVVIDYDAEKPLKQANFRISLERQDGLICHVATSPQQGIRSGPLSGPGRVVLQYKTLNLLPHLYQVAVDVFEGANPIPITRVRQRNYFQIASDCTDRGAVHLEHDWKLEEAS